MNFVTPATKPHSMGLGIPSSHITAAMSTPKTTFMSVVKKR